MVVRRLAAAGARVMVLKSRPEDAGERVELRVGGGGSSGFEHRSWLT